MFDFFFRFFSHDIGIDLGTANTLVYVLGKGILIREPSVVARHKKSKKILGIGVEARKMLGKTPATIEAIRPLVHGVISDFDVTSAMLSFYIRKVHQTPSMFPKIPRPVVCIGIPSGVTEVERRAVQAAALSAGARKCFLIEEPMAAAIGSNLPILSSSGSLIVDIGGGTTEMAVISLGGIVANRSIRVAGLEMDQAIIRYVRLKYGLIMGEVSAEDVKIAIGSLAVAPKMQKSKNDEEVFAVIRGRDIETGLPKSLKISSSEVREAILPIIHEIVQNLFGLIEETPPELLSDILEKGVVLCGGGALLRNLDVFIGEQIKLPVWVTNDPQTAVVRGCAKVLKDQELLGKVRVSGGLRE